MARTSTIRQGTEKSLRGPLLVPAAASGSRVGNRSSCTRRCTTTSTTSTANASAARAPSTLG
jgi:hypothetical protein